MARKFVMRVEFVETDDEALIDISPEDWLRETLEDSGELETIQNLSISLDSVLVGEYKFVAKEAS